MIKVTFYRKKDRIIGFEIKNHGRDIVCSAVSILSLNTINSLEAFTDVKYKLDYDTNGGFLKYFIDINFSCNKTNLLLNSLELGIKGILAEYPRDISLKYKEV